jgi:voltage-gated potassium channel
MFIDKLKLRIYNTIRDDDKNDLLSTIVDTIIIFFILLNVLIIILDTFDDVRVHIEKTYYYVEVVSLVIFTIEYFLRVWTSVYIYPGLKPGKARLKYIFSAKALIDLIALLPFYFSLLLNVNIQILRMVRLVRILSILKVNRYSMAISTIGQVIKRKAAQLLSSLLVVILLIVFSSVLMYYIEHNSQPEVFNNAFSGLWWAIATLTTVGYGDIYPITILGKILGTIIAMLGIGLVAVPTGIISAGFIEQMNIKNKHENNNFCPHCGKKLRRQQHRIT